MFINNDSIPRTGLRRWHIWSIYGVRNCSFLMVSSPQEFWRIFSTLSQQGNVSCLAIVFGYADHQPNSDFVQVMTLFSAIAVS
jgi:hypothetical protein